MAVFTLRGETVDDLLLALSRQQPGAKPRLVLFFADARFDPAALVAGLSRMFPAPAICCGCSAYMGWTSEGGLYEHGMTLVTLGDELVEAAAVETVTAVTSLPDPTPQLQCLSAALGTDLRNADPGQYAGLILTEGFAFGLDVLLERLGDQALLPFVGGTAGDAMRFRDTWVAASGQVHKDASVLCVMKMRRPFVIGKTQSFKIAFTRQFIPRRRPNQPFVYDTFNDEPAAAAYLRAAAVPADLSYEAFISCSTRQPLGLQVENDLFAFIPHRVLPDGGLEMFGAPRIDWPLHLLSWTDVVSGLEEALARMRAQLPTRPALVLEFICSNRVHALLGQNRVDDYLRVYGDTPVAGFSTFGESYYANVNATSTFLMIGDA